MARELSIAAVRLGGRPAIVAAGGEQDVAALAGANGANIAELRGDLFEQPTPDAIVAAIKRLRAAGRGTAPGQLPVAELASLVARLFPS